MVEWLVAEFEQETRVTRPFLERLPEGRLAWRPHERSFRAGHLGAHLVDCLRWTAPIFGGEALDVDPSMYRGFRAGSVAELLEGFDSEVAAARTALSAANDAELLGPWELSFRGTPRWRKPRLLAFRDLSLNHLIHHRGQLSVYLRLMGVPVPGAYGPTADE